MKIPNERQRQQPLELLSGRLDDTQLGWATIEKEAYAIIASCDRMAGWLSEPAEFNMYTDHNDLTYLLLLRNDYSYYCWLFPFEEAKAENSVNAILECRAPFTPPGGLMFDGESHFQDETMRLVSLGLKTPHHFTLVHTPWSSGGVERLGTEVLRILRAVMSELRMAPNERPELFSFFSCTSRTHLLLNEKTFRLSRSSAD